MVTGLDNKRFYKLRNLYADRLLRLKLRTLFSVRQDSVVMSEKVRGLLLYSLNVSFYKEMFGI